MKFNYFIFGWIQSLLSNCFPIQLLFFFFFTNVLFDLFLPIVSMVLYFIISLPRVPTSKDISVNCKAVFEFFFFFLGIFVWIMMLLLISHYSLLFPNKLLIKNQHICHVHIRDQVLCISMCQIQLMTQRKANSDIILSTSKNKIHFTQHWRIYIHNTWSLIWLFSGQKQ